MGEMDGLRVIFVSGLIFFVAGLVWLVIMSYRGKKRRIMPILAVFLLLLGFLAILVVFEIDHTYGVSRQKLIFNPAERN